VLHAYVDPPIFVDNVDMVLGEGALDDLTNNTQILDSLSFRSPEVTHSSAGKDTSTPGYYVGTGGEIIYRGSFQMQSGMTTLTIEGWAQKGASESFQLFLNGAGISTTAVPNGATFTLTASLSSLSAGDIGEVVVQISGSGYGGSGVATKYVVYSAYVSPISVGAVWSGVPTFAGTYNQSLLNQLSGAQAYLAARLAAIPYVPMLAQYYAHGSSVTSDVYPLWWGAVERGNGSNILNIRILSMIMGNQAEFYRVKVGGSTVHTGATLAAGQTRDDYLSIDLSSFSSGARLETVIETVVTTGPAAGPSGDRNSRYHVWAVRMSNSATAVMSAPYEFTADESLASTSLDTKLNALSTALSAAKTRLDNNGRIFNRVELMRKMYGRDTGQWSVYTPANTYVQRFVRKGSRLVIRGKNVSVGWGALNTKSDKTTTNVYIAGFAHTQQITSGDAIETKTIYLDALPELRRGLSYTVFGEDLVYCAELL
jgi:hypothetical protein